MRSVVLSLAALLAFAGTVAAQTKSADTNRGTTATTKKTPVGAKAPAPTKATNTSVQKAACSAKARGPSADCPEADGHAAAAPRVALRRLPRRSRNCRRRSWTSRARVPSAW